MLSFLSRTPFSIMGAFGLLAFASGTLDLHKNIQDWIAAWMFITRPIWEFLFGLLGVILSDWMKDYLSLGAISLGMISRAARFYKRHTEESPFSNEERRNNFHIILFYTFLSIIVICMWPIFVLGVLISRSLEISFTKRERALVQHSIKGAHSPIAEALLERRAVAVSSLQIFLETAGWFALLVALNYGLLYGGAT